MDANSYGNGVDIKITIRGIIRTLSVICAGLVFCPAFLVSCSGQTISLSAMKTSMGIKMYGSKVSSAHPMLLLTLILPIVIFALFFARRIRSKTLALVILVCSIADLIMWIVFRSAVKKAAEDSYFDFKGRFGFYLSIISIVLMIIASSTVAFTRMSFKTNLLTLLSQTDATTSAMSQMSMAVSRASDRVSKVAASISASTAERSKTVSQSTQEVCSKCGATVKQGSQFCIRCGSPVKQEKSDPFDEPAVFCTKCGSKLEAVSDFCPNCGNRV